jgi:hypothetical protein
MHEIKLASTFDFVERELFRFLLLATVLLLCGVAAHAQQSPHASEGRIFVTGDGSVSVRPSYAQLRTGVTTRSKTVKEGVNVSSKLMGAIIAALKASGITEKDIQTAHFSIQPVYESQEPRTGPKLSGYNISNRVNVTVREIDKVGDVLDAVVAAGATDVGSVSFSIADESEALNEARKIAIADARRKAEVYAKASGVQLGGVVSITEDSGATSAPMMARASPTAVPMAGGEDTLQVRITVGFEIAR